MLERLKWYRRRLAAMSAAEIASRSKRTFVHLSDDALFRASPARWRAGWQPPADGLLAGRPLRKPIGFMRPERGAGLRTNLPIEAEKLSARAEQALAGRVRFFGYPAVQLPENRVEDVDPFTGRSWPDRHGKRLDYRHLAVGDPKWIWELNRCQDLSVLTAAWLVTGDERYGRTAGERLLAWPRTHPPGRGIAWSSGFEAGIRAISLALTVDGLRGSPFLADAELELALTALWQHGRWMRRDPSLGSSANNHRLGELVGLVVIAALAPELRDAARWREEALEDLSTEAGRQIHPDGTSAEQAFSYHLFVVDLLLLATAVLDACEQSVPHEVTAAIERSGDALWAQLGVNEPPPTYGDTDDGRAFVLDASDLRESRGVAAAIAARFVHPRAKRAAEVVDATAWWLFGTSGIELFERTALAPPPESVSLPAGGLTILRKGRTRAIFDHGPHGYTSLAAHAHADALRVDVALGAEELIVDPGVGSYFARPVLRAAFRGTSFHPTVSVDGLDSSLPGGPFLWTRHARARLLACDPEAGFVVAEHDGYQRLPDPVSHRRAVVGLSNGSILVVDRLVARGPHRYSQRWPLHPDLELDCCSSTLAAASGRRAGILLSISSSTPIEVTAIRGEDDPLSGWWSERLESAVPSWLVAANAEVEGSVELATLLVPFEAAGGIPDTKLHVSDGRDCLRMHVSGASDREVIAVDLRSSPVRVTRDESSAATPR